LSASSIYDHISVVLAALIKLDMHLNLFRIVDLIVTVVVRLNVERYKG